MAFSRNTATALAIRPISSPAESPAMPSPSRPAVMSAMSRESAFNGSLMLLAIPRPISATRATKAKARIASL